MRHNIVLLLLIIVLALVPVTAARIVYQGDTVSVGESGLDITNATGGIPTISWYDSPVVGEPPRLPAKMIDVSQTAANFYVNPNLFAASIGAWYRDLSRSVAFYVISSSKNTINVVHPSGNTFNVSRLYPQFSIIIDPVGDKYIDDEFTVTATTNLPAGEDVQGVVIYPSFHPTQPNTFDKKDVCTVKVRQGNNSLNRTYCSVDTQGWVPDTYVLVEYATNQSARNTTAFNITACGMNATSVSFFSWANRQGVNWMTSVKDQGECGACYAEGTTGAVEAKYNIEQGSQKNLDLSEQTLISPCSNKYIGSCVGGFASLALEYLKSDGITDEACFPYQSSNCGYHLNSTSGFYECNISGNCSIPQTCSRCTDWPSRIWKITNFSAASGQVDHVKQELLCKGPLVASSNKWRHVVTLVGWDDSYDNGSWIIKNSWGTGYQEGGASNGYGTIRFFGDARSDLKNYTLYAEGVYHV